VGAVIWRRGSAAEAAGPGPESLAPPVAPAAPSPPPTAAKPRVATRSVAPPTPPAAKALAAKPSPAGAAPSSTKPAAAALAAEDLAVLEILAQEDRLPEARTAWAVAISLERRPDQVNSILTKLAGQGAAESSVVRVGGEVWAVTEDGAKRLDSR
jgi:hypothetical protein